MPLEPCDEEVASSFPLWPELVDDWSLVAPWPLNELELLVELWLWSKAAPCALAAPCDWLPEAPDVCPLKDWSLVPPLFSEALLLREEDDCGSEELCDELDLPLSD